LVPLLITKEHKMTVKESNLMKESVGITPSITGSIDCESLFSAMLLNFALSDSSNSKLLFSDEF
jgi:hypothetical protein